MMGEQAAKRPCPFHLLVLLSVAVAVVLAIAAYRRNAAPRVVSTTTTIQVQRILYEPKTKP